VPALAQDPTEARQLGPGHAGEPHALGLEMHGPEAGDVVEDRRDQRPDDHLAVGDLHELRHHEGGRAHDGRHDLAARGRHGLDARGEMRLEARCAS
jgi:hypothetical protein